MESWVDVISAAVGLSLIVGAHIWFFSSERHSSGINVQQAMENRMWKMPCKTHPNGMDGIPCDPNGLMPPKPPY